MVLACGRGVASWGESARQLWPPNKAFMDGFDELEGSKGRAAWNLMSKSTSLPKSRFICSAPARLPAAALVLVCGSGWASIHLHTLCVGFYISPQSVLPLQEMWWLVSAWVHSCSSYCRLPVEAGAFPLFALVQLPCLLNSNLGLKCFLIKTKPEPPPGGQQTKPTDRLGVCLMEGLCLQWGAGFPALGTFCSLWYSPAVGVSLYLI